MAALRWIASPGALLEAIERQHRMPVPLLGDAMLALGLLTKDQLNWVLATQTGDKPLGELLVAAGIISRSDLQTALAHKMGYPLVDLKHFPIDPAAVAKLPHRVAKGYQVMPLLLDKDRLIIAVDKPSRARNSMHCTPMRRSRSCRCLPPRHRSCEHWSACPTMCGHRTSRIVQRSLPRLPKSHHRVRLMLAEQE